MLLTGKESKVSLNDINTANIMAIINNQILARGKGQRSYIKGLKCRFLACTGCCNVVSVKHEGLLVDIKKRMYCIIHCKLKSTFKSLYLRCILSNKCYTIIGFNEVDISIYLPEK